MWSWASVQHLLASQYDVVLQTQKLVALRWRIMFNLILKIQDLRMRSKFMWLRKGLVAGCYEHGNGLSLSVEGWKFLGKLNDDYLLKKGCAARS
jgi:hypothetical protein